MSLPGDKVLAATTLLALLLFAASACGEDAVVLAKAGLTHARPADEISFTLARHYLPAVFVSVNGRHRLRFVIDTGSGRTILDQGLARKLKLHGQRVHLTSVDKATEAVESTIEVLELGPASFHAVPVLVRDLGFLRKPLGVAVDGILGFDLLSRHSFRLDYVTHKLTLADCAAEGFRVPFASMTPMVGVRVDIGGRTRNLLVDTAASQLQLFDPGDLPAEKLPQRRAFGAGGEFTVREIALPSLRLGSDGLGARPAYIVDSRPEDTRDFDGLLSPVALGITHMCFDFARNEFSWRR